MYISLPIFFLFLSASCLDSQRLAAQSYSTLVQQADSLYMARQYSQSAATYATAFILQQKNPSHLYNAACSAALSAQPDQAFVWLEAALASGWTDHAHMATDTDLTLLRADIRWANLLDRMKSKAADIEANMDKPLRDTLLTIFDDDQKYRLMLDSIRKNFGRESTEMKALWRIINEKDSLNLLQIKSILDRRGWVGSDLVGSRANQAIFLVIQHADQKTQEYYLPKMREAVQKGNAKASSLALLEDRVALGQGKKQRYGSQIGYDKTAGKSYLLPLDDPDHVDERRAAMGLGPLADYLRRWQIVWDVEAYKKQQAENPK